ncbi:MAG: dicarboxylate/amino acid:cation symporter [Planctomycetota bacterium]
MSPSLDTRALQVLHPRSLKHLHEHLQGLVRGRLWLQVLVAMVAGTALGIAIGPSAGWVAPRTAETVSSWLALPGQVFLGLIQMIVVPLVFASIIRGICASEDVERLKRMGLAAVSFFLVTTVVAIVIGLVLAMTIRPGDFIDQGLVGGAAAAVPHVEAAEGGPTPLPDVIVGLLPTNPLGAMVDREMLQVVLFAIFIGIAMVSLRPDQARPLIELLGTFQLITMTVVRWAMLLVPLAVFGLMVQLSARLGLDALVGMSVYVGTVLLGLVLLLVMYVILAASLGGRSVLRFVRSVRDLQLLAFSTSSSAAVMPLSMRTAEEKLGVRSSVSQFVIPLGATLNMTGTALYQGVATVFLAQVFSVDLSMADLALVVVTAVAASIGSPAAPGVGIVILAMVLGSVGIPLAGIGLIMGVDRILDMSRTAVNVTGDIVAATVLDRFVGGATTADEQNEASQRREAERAQSGADVIVDPLPGAVASKP